MEKSVAFKLQCNWMNEFYIREYVTADGRSPFSDWLNKLQDIRARARIRNRLDRVRLGNIGDHVSVGEGVFELRLFYGPGYRVYFAKTSRNVLLLMHGGVKNTQSQDIKRAKNYLTDFWRRIDDNE